MKFYKNLSRWGKLGLIIFLFINISFIFLLLSPIIPNFIGEMLDNQLLSECENRINQIRKTTIRIQIQYANGTPVQGYNVIFNQIDHEFFFGCNIFSFDSFNKTGYNETYREYFKRLFNFAVLPFYWRTYEPEEGVYPTEARINNTLNWCLQNNITTKGHPLVWTRIYGKPDWIFSKNNTELIKILEKRVKSLITKYKDKIKYWDIVNEPIHTEPFAGLNKYDFVYRTIQWANETNITIDLTINEYGILIHDFGNGSFYQFLNNLISQDSPFHLIGIQAHEPRTDWIPATEIWKTLEINLKFKNLFI